jgi:hypothetical protein
MKSTRSESGNPQVTSRGSREVAEDESIRCLREERRRATGRPGQQILAIPVEYSTALGYAPACRPGLTSARATQGAESRDPLYFADAG